MFQSLRNRSGILNVVWKALKEFKLSFTNKTLSKPKKLFLWLHLRHHMLKKAKHTKQKNSFPLCIVSQLTLRCTYFLSSPPGYHGKRTYMFIAIFDIPARVVYKYRILIKVKVNPVFYVLFLTERLKTNFDNPFF